jgi:protein-L-isoaspartate(D-aspartate) O-methyltransferase
MLYEKERRGMVRKLITNGFLKSERIIHAMDYIPRHIFLNEKYAAFGYEDCPLSIGKGQTISAPHMVAIMCECLDLKQGQKVLEIGSGSGYHASIVSSVIGDGMVYSIERLPELATIARSNIKKVGCDRVKIIVGDGNKGYNDEAPFDRIYVTAGGMDIPNKLLEQLLPDGKLLMPIGSRNTQDLILVEKNKGSVIRKNFGMCRFVPLVGEFGWIE